MSNLQKLIGYVGEVLHAGGEVLPVVLPGGEVDLIVYQIIVNLRYALFIEAQPSTS